MPTAEPAILFPTDFGPHSKAAFQHAIHLAADRRCPVIALHVANQPDMCGSRLGGPTYHEEIQQQLLEFDSELVAVDRKLVVADPGPAICKQAAEAGCQLIFMGITNKVGLDQIGMGGVHEYVCHHATCPVITLCLQPCDAVQPGGP